MSTSLTKRPSAQSHHQASYARRFASFYTRSFEKRPLLTISVANSILGGIGDAAAQALPILLGTGPVTFDVARSLRFFAYGFMLGPVAGKWNELLEKRIPLRTALPLVNLEKVKVKVEESEKLASRSTSPQPPSSPLARPMPLPATAHIGRTAPLQPIYPSAPSTSAPGRVSLMALGKRVAADQLIMAPLGIFVFLTAMSLMEGLDMDGWLDRLKQLFLPVLLVNWKIWPILQAINFRFLPLSLRVPFTASCGILWTIFLSARQAAVAQQTKVAAP